MKVIEIFIVKNNVHLEQMYLLENGKYILNETYFTSNGTWVSELVGISEGKALSLLNVGIQSKNDK